jgi:hypothetical protein
MGVVACMGFNAVPSEARRLRSSPKGEAAGRIKHRDAEETSETESFSFVGRLTFNRIISIRPSHAINYQP